MRSAHGDVKTDKEAGRQRYKVYPTCSGGLAGPGKGGGNMYCRVFLVGKSTRKMITSEANHEIFVVNLVNGRILIIKWFNRIAI